MLGITLNHLYTVYICIAVAFLGSDSDQHCQKIYVVVANSHTKFIKCNYMTIILYGLKTVHNFTLPNGNLWCKNTFYLAILILTPSNKNFGVTKFLGSRPWKLVTFLSHDHYHFKGSCIYLKFDKNYFKNVAQILYFC